MAGAFGRPRTGFLLLGKQAFIQLNFGRVEWLVVEWPEERRVRQLDQVGGHCLADWAEVPKGDAGGGEAVQDLLDGLDV